MGLGMGLAGWHRRPVDYPATKLGEPVKGGLFDDGLGDSGHWDRQGLTTSTPSPSKSRTFRVATGQTMSLGGPCDEHIDEIRGTA